MFLINRYFVFLIFTSSCQLISGYYHRIFKDDSFAKTGGDLSKNVELKVLKTLDNNLFPLEFTCSYIDSKNKVNNLHFKLIDGIINKPSQLVDTYESNRIGSLKKINFNTDLKTESYRSIDENAVATLIENSDLNGKDISMAFKFRAIITAYNNETNEEYHIVPFIVDIKSSITKIGLKINSRLEHRIYERNYLKVNFGNDAKKTYFLKQNDKLEDIIEKNENETEPMSLFVEALIVADYSSFKKHQKFLNITVEKTTVLFMKIFFSHLINGVNQRYLNSFKENQDIKIEVRLKNFVIQTTPSFWTNISIVGVANYPTYNGKEVVQATKTLIAFRSFVENSVLPFQFDHAFGIFDKDIWADNEFLTPAQRAGVVGTAWVGGVCGSFRQSIIEDLGFNTIIAVTHELGHNLGSYHDGDISNSNAVLCPPAENYIMTPSGGLTSNFQNLFKFSNCSIAQFKSTLLDNKRTVKQRYNCLANIPISQPIEATYYEGLSTGQLFDVNSQCKLILGVNSTHQGCETYGMCETIYCRLGNTCRSMRGWGAVDGTPCGIGRTCQLGKCELENSTTKEINLCKANPCLNNGTCIETAKFYICNCEDGYLGLNCEIEPNKTD